MTSASDSPSDSQGPARAEFDQLLRGHATLTLTAQERARLRALSAGAPERAAAIAAFDAVHREFARERALFGLASAPAEPAEEGDEGHARLAAAGARAEAELRSKLVHAPAPFARPRVRAGRAIAVGVAALAAALVLVVWLATASAPPALLPGAPDGAVAGGDGKSIVIAPRLSAADRVVSWSPLWHAHSYDVVIVDARGNVVLERAKDLARSTRWELTVAEFAQLQGRRQELRLRVRALDGSGLAVATSGDLPLDLR